MIDEDIRKKEFGLDYEVLTSKEALEQKVFEKVNHLVICSEERVKSILDTLKLYGISNNEINVYYIDKNCAINSLL